MMDAVPTADVIVTNPTHFSVALRYDSEQLAPVVVAKGADLLALRIRAERRRPASPSSPTRRWPARSTRASRSAG